MCCGDPPEAPDLSASANASMEVGQMAQQTSREQLEWARQQDTMNRETLNQVLEVQLPAMRDQFENARADRSRWEEFFRPMEDEFAQYAQNYDTPERREEARAKAMADTATQFDASRRNALQRLEGFGVDPSQTRNSALDIGVRTAEAAAKVGAATGADRYIEGKGEQLRGQAIQLGRGVVGGVGGQYAGAVGAGGQAVSGSNATTGTSSSAINSTGSWGNQALGGFGQNANIQNSGFQNEMDNWDASQQQSAGMLQGIGSIAGMAMGMKDGGMAINPHGGMDIEGDFQELDGDVNGPGTGTSDSIPAMLSNGEYVVPADVVRAKGEEFFDRLLEQYHDGPAPDTLKIDRKAA